MTAEQVQHMVEDIDAERELVGTERQDVEDWWLAHFLEAPYPTVATQCN